MRTGRLSISRGHQLQGEPVAIPPQLTLVPQPAGSGPAPVSVLERAPPASPDYQLVHDRLTSLERLTRLFELGALSAEEFAAEKALVLGLPADELVLRTLAPVDIEAITASVMKTGRCVIAHEATRTSGFGAELSALVQEACFYHLEAPIERVTGWDTPYPHAFEWEYFPGQKRVGAALKRVMEA